MSQGHQKGDAKRSGVHSMTGYANAQQATRAGTLTLEMRSVNSRFLDLNFRMPDDLRSVEPLIREKLMSRLSRGKVECRISWGRSEATTALPGVDLTRVEQLAALQSKIQQVVPGAGGFRIGEILNYPGVLETQELSQDELTEAISGLADQAIGALLASRLREGQQLAAVLLERIAGMEGIVNDLEPRLPEFVAHYEGKLRERMNEAFEKVRHEKAGHLSQEDLEERIRHEVTLHGVRIDVSEEIDRLRTHFKEVRRILSQGGTIGKRLDFITQELNREANTLGSKAHAITQTQASVDLKVLMEQFREQVQNIE